MQGPRSMRNNLSLSAQLREHAHDERGRQIPKGRRPTPKPRPTHVAKGGDEAKRLL